MVAFTRFYVYFSRKASSESTMRSRWDKYDKFYICITCWPQNLWPIDHSHQTPELPSLSTETLILRVRVPSSTKYLIVSKTKHLQRNLLSIHFIVCTGLQPCRGKVWTELSRFDLLQQPILFYCMAAIKKLTWKREGRMKPLSCKGLF